MLCDKCGNKIPEELDYCPMCKIINDQNEKTETLDKNDSINTLKTILVTIIIIFILGIGTYFLFGESFKIPDDNNAEKDIIDSSDNSKADKFINMTKEEAITTLNNMSENNSYIPDNFVNSNLLLQKGEFNLKILYSYNNIDEVKEIAINSIFDEVKYSSELINVIPIDDKYVVVYVNSTECLDHCYRGISFNKEYVDYYEEKTEVSEVITTNERFIIKKFDKNFVEEILSTLIYSIVPIDLSNIYDYSFEEKDNIFIMRTYSLGVGLDPTKFEDMTPDNIEYSINLIERELYLDKNTGEINWRYESDENKNKVLKSIPLNNKDINKLKIDL